ncbi:MAG: hypothetical protein WD230_09380, partial [Cucumibacter sp.]
MSETATSIHQNGRHIRLKWHKLRRHAGEPPFSPYNLRYGLSVGASMEVDIQPLADGNWVFLHDEVLDAETDGSGPVAAIGEEQVRLLRIRGGEFSPPLLSDLAPAFDRAHPGACLQFDLKGDATSISDLAAHQFAAAVAPIAAQCLVSGTDWAAVTRLGRSVSGLKLGFDPQDLVIARMPVVRDQFENVLEEILELASGADTYYLSHQFVTAALAVGCNPVEKLKSGVGFVDVWTLDPTMAEFWSILSVVAEAGADQITTNDPSDLASSLNIRAE